MPFITSLLVATPPLTVLGRTMPRCSKAHPT